MANEGTSGSERYSPMLKNTVGTRCAPRVEVKKLVYLSLLEENRLHS